MSKQFVRNIFTFFIVYLLITLFTFQFLSLTFFQQDEWAIFGNYLYWQKASLNWFERLFVFEQFTHLIPFSNIFSFLQFKLFQTQFYPYTLISIFLHLVNSLLVSYLGRILFKKNILAFLAGLFFLVNSISHQATTWIATASGTQGSVFFVLLCLIFFTKYLVGNSERKRHLCLSFIFFVISLLFKETSIFLFLFLPLYGLIMKSKRNKRIIVLLIILGVFYLSLRTSIAVIAARPAPAISELAQPNLTVYMYRAVVMPLRVLTQSIVPAEYIIKASNFLIKVAYPQFIAADLAPNPFIAESSGADIVLFWFAALILFILSGLYFIFKRREKDSYARIIILSIIFIGLSSFPFIFVPGRAGFLSLLDGRHLYLTSIFTSILLSTVFFGLYELFNRKRFSLFLLTIIIILFSVLHVSQVRNDISKQVSTGQLREKLLNEILNKYPRLPEKIVFYIQSDKSFYGVEGNILPFQSGLGQTLLVWYDSHGESFPPCFFNDQFLYVQLSQGYRECQGRGFGYFREENKFEEFIKENKVENNQIIAFQYVSSEERLIDITREIQVK